MSIIGGAKLFKVTDRIETSLLKGIMDIATESGKHRHIIIRLSRECSFVFRCMDYYKWI